MSSRSISAQCGHVKRQLSDTGYLKGKSLLFALEVIEEKLNENPKNDDFLITLKEKIANEKPLSEYEYHLFVEVILLHKRLES